MSDPTSTVPPGWYPDQNGRHQWWDGTQWADTPALRAPEGSKTGTAWIWLIVLLLPLLGALPLALADWGRLSLESLEVTVLLFTWPGAPGNPVVYGLTIWFAVLDVRLLKQRGVPEPFHWATAFLTPIVYVIGRSVIVKRRTGGGLAPLWAYVGVSAAGIIAFLVVDGLVIQYLHR